MNSGIDAAHHIELLRADIEPDVLGAAWKADRIGHILANRRRRGRRGIDDRLVLETHWRGWLQDGADEVVIVDARPAVAAFAHGAGPNRRCGFALHVGSSVIDGLRAGRCTRETGRILAAVRAMSSVIPGPPWTVGFNGWPFWVTLGGEDTTNVCGSSVKTFCALQPFRRLEIEGNRAVCRTRHAVERFVQACGRRRIVDAAARTATGYRRQEFLGTRSIGCSSFVCVVFQNPMPQPPAAIGKHRAYLRGFHDNLALVAVANNRHRRWRRLTAPAR